MKLASAEGKVESREVELLGDFWQPGDYLDEEDDENDRPVQDLSAVHWDDDFQSEDDDEEDANITDVEPEIDMADSSIKKIP